MENKVGTKKSRKNSVENFPTKEITLTRDSYVKIKLGDRVLSISVRNSDSPYVEGSKYQYVMIHHDTNFKEITFSDSLGAKIATTSKTGSIYDVSINEERV